MKSELKGLSHLNVECLFEEPIETQDNLGGHASDVWLIKTSKEEVVVRASGVREDSDAPFYMVVESYLGMSYVEHLNWSS